MDTIMWVELALALAAFCVAVPLLYFLPLGIQLFRHRRVRRRRSVQPSRPDSPPGS